LEPSCTHGPLKDIKNRTVCISFQNVPFVVTNAKIGINNTYHPKAPAVLKIDYVKYKYHFSADGKRKRNYPSVTR
jgi:hypothetical protein